MNRPWLRMQKSLIDHPKVVAISEQTNTHVAHVVGGLLVVWGVADNNDGTLPFWTQENVDRASGIPGMGRALVDIGWLSESASGLQVKDYEDWMGGKVHAKDQAATRKARQRDAEGSKSVKRDIERDTSVTSSVTSSVTGVTPNVTRTRRRPSVTNLGHGVGHPSPSPSPSPSPLKQQDEEKKREQINRMKRAAERTVDQELLTWVQSKGVCKWFKRTFEDWPVGQVRMLGQDHAVRDVEEHLRLAALRGATMCQVRQILSETEARKRSIEKPPRFLLAKLEARLPLGVGVTP